jgi:hypothetical protein
MPSCSDEIQNKNEEDVDCGGVCDACPGYCGDDIVDSLLGKECDDGNTGSCDSCAYNRKNETAPGTCDQVVVLQNKEERYVTLDGTNDVLSWEKSAELEGDAEVFIRESTSCGFTLKLISNGYFVQILNNELSAMGDIGAVINTEACGTDPTGFGALRVDTKRRWERFRRRRQLLAKRR